MRPPPAPPAPTEHLRKSHRTFNFLFFLLDFDFEKTKTQTLTIQIPVLISDQSIGDDPSDVPEDGLLDLNPH